MSHFVTGEGKAEDHCAHGGQCAAQFMLPFIRDIDCLQSIPMGEVHGS